MPPVVQFTIAYAAGLAAGRVPALLVGGMLAAAVALVPRRRRAWTALLAAAGAIGACQSLVLLRAQRATCAVRWTTGRQAAIVRLGDPPTSRGLAEALVLHAPGGCAGPVRLRLGRQETRGGVTAVVVGRFQGGTLRVERLRVLGHPPAWRFAVRDRVAARIGHLYGPRAPVIEALVLGRRGDLDPRLRADFVAAGLAHLLAISGLHVGIVAAWVSLVARACRLARWAGAISAAAVWAYAILLGFPAPATRAAAFVAIGAAARARQRHPAASAGLATAVLIVLAVDPGAIAQAGAWLSAAAVWGTSEALAVVRRHGRPHAATALLAASVGAVLATAPITALVFGQVALAGVVVNLVAVPLAGAIVPGVLASLALGGSMAAGAGAALALLERVAAVGATLPFGRVASDPGPAAAIPWMVVLGGAVWLARRRPSLPVVGVRAGAIAACLAWGTVARDWWSRDRYDGLTIYVLAVGQGDAIVLRSPRGRWGLVDAGPRTARFDAGRSVVAPFLRRRGVRRLDWLVVTHGDADHLGGVPAVLASVPAEVVLEPGQPLGTALYGEYLGAVDAAGARWHAARRGDGMTWDGVHVEVLHPGADWVDRELRPNENSVVLRVRYGAFDALLAGDAGLPVESLLVDGVGQVELLKIGHHGSAGSTGAAWVGALRPRIAVVSVGPNTYGHPHPAVLARLDSAGVATWRTDRCGTVTIRSDGLYLAVHQGSPYGWLRRLGCPDPDSSPSRASSSSRSGGTPRRPGNSPTSFTTWPSRPR